MTDQVGSTQQQHSIAVDRSNVVESNTFGQREQPINSKMFSSALERMSIIPSTDQTLAVYVHLPFCPTQCMSCDRIAVITHDSVVIDNYLASLDSEMALVSKQLGHGWKLSQVLVGGGTPNYLADAQLARVVAMLDRHFEISTATRMAIECNPGRTSHHQLALISGLGFDELRFEMREIDPLSQSGLGRSHSPELIQDTVDNARSAGLKRLSFELAFGLPNQTRDSIRRSMLWLTELGPEEITCSEFIRKEQLFENQKMIDPTSLPRLAEKMKLYSIMMEVLDEAGYVWLGPNTFVKPDDPMLADRQQGVLFQNRLGYTSKRDNWVLGFGMGSVSELPGLLAQNWTNIQRWQTAIASGKHAAVTGVQLSLPESIERIAFANLGAHLVVRTEDISTPLGVALLGQLEQAQLVSVEQGKARLSQRGIETWPQILEGSSEELWWLTV